ncbi:MAG: DUF5602 domain-containing protein [Candidatus Kapaibacterium sp.]
MSFRLLNRWGAATLLLATLTFAGCSEDPVTPEDKSGTFATASQDLGNGSAKLFVTLDKDGDPTEVGLRITEDALQGLPDQEAPVTLWFNIPSQGSTTVINHVSLDWNGHGHEPAMIFDVPHFDMHFYMMTEAERLAIDPALTEKVENVPDAKYIPADYVTPPPIAAVPQMGVHWIDSKDASITPGNFTEVMIFGSWDGNLTFIEPMMTKAWLDTKPTLEELIKLPEAYQKNGFYPTTYKVSFDTTTNEYVITLGGMVERQAS